MHTGLRILIIGGDARNAKLAQILSMDGHYVECMGFDWEHTITNSGMNCGLEKIEECAGKAELVIGPIPFTLDGTNINAPFSDKSLPVTRLLSSMKKDSILIAGIISDVNFKYAEARGIKVIDFIKREDMAILNAIPTAEGAIQIAMEELPVTLNGVKALVLGFGRVGKLLCKLLQGLGAIVCADSINPIEAAWIRGYGYEHVRLEDLDSRLAWADLIYNTVPVLILTKSRLMMLNPECVVIEIASKPGGIDLEAARELGISIIQAPSLPGKVAPVTSARCIRETVYNILNELGG